MEIKTNVMRLLDKENINYKSYSYADTDAISGMDVAAVLEQDSDQVFKTLVTVGKSNQYFVYVIPVSKELDLKKAAACVNEKSIEMIKSKDLLKITGYIHGGCSLIGMKKTFITTIDASAKGYQTIIFSAGKIGYQIEMTIDDLNKIIPVQLYDVVV